jgi:hypothetical protein
MALRGDDKFNDEMQRCEVNSWRMNPAAIIATALAHLLNRQGGLGYLVKIYGGGFSKSQTL